MKNSFKALLLSLASCKATEDTYAEPNPPSWDTQSVKLLDPNDPQGSQKVVDDIYAEMGGFKDGEDLVGQWS